MKLYRVLVKMVNDDIEYRSGDPIFLDEQAAAVLIAQSVLSEISLPDSVDVAEARQLALKRSVLCCGG